MAVAVAVAGGPACRGRHEPAAGEARLSVDGRTEVRADGAARWKVARGGTLHSGDAVRVVRGKATLRMAGRRQLELRPRSQVRVAVAPTLERGDLLVVTPDVDTHVVAGAVTAIVSRGSARLSRSLAFEGAAYAGSLALSSAGEEVRVPALRQASITATGLVPARAVPLAYRERDPWDRRFLGSWMEVGRDLEARSRGVTAQLQPGEGTTPGFFRLLLPQLPDDRLPALLAGFESRPPGETLVGAAISAESHRGTFDDRWHGVFGFRDEGAAWGLVAADQAVRAADITGALDSALGRFGSQLALPATVGGHRALLTPPLRPASDGGITNGPSPAGSTPVSTPSSPGASTLPPSTTPTTGANGPGPTLPPVTTPSITTPPVTTPPVTTPPVTTPPITAPPLTILPRTVLPTVTVPPVIVPTVPVGLP